MSYLYKALRRLSARGNAKSGENRDKNEVTVHGHCEEIGAECGLRGKQSRGET